jgi:threonylcarbamoyladenosine tRNA methylthiotransferase MtaB
MSAIDVLTFGCRLNIFESEVMRRHAEEAGLSDLVIVHS